MLLDLNTLYSYIINKKFTLAPPLATNIKRGLNNFLGANLGKHKPQIFLNV